MQVRMKATLSGTRDGEPWPERGGIVELPDEEATHLCAAGLAEAVSDAPAEESATPKASPETATPKRGRSAK